MVPSPPTAPQATAACRVLVVDGDARVARALGALVSATAVFAVAAIATTAASAVAADREHSPELAVVDVMLPTRDDGLEVIRSLAARGRVVVATSVSAVVREAALLAGAAAFVEKGTDPEAVIAALAESRGG